MIAALAAMLATIAPVQDGPKIGPFDGFGRGVHVFGDYIVDFGWGVQYWDIAISGHIFGARRMSKEWPPTAEICNTVQFYCVRSSDADAPVQLVVPRRCRRLAIGETFTANGRSTIVLAASPGIPAPLVDHPSVDRYLLGDTRRADVAFVYQGPQGVTGFFRSNGDSSDLREAARRGALDRLPDKVNGVPAWLTFHISSPDTFAACKGSGYLLPKG